LLKHDKEKDVIEFRHYSIKLQPVGVSRRIRKLMQNNQVPDLGEFEDVSEFVKK
jgi:ribosome biogenesis protein SSF1/2